MEDSPWDELDQRVIDTRQSSSGELVFTLA